MKSPRAAGHLVIIGGAEDKEGECKILREFLRLAGQEKSRIVVMTVASHYPDEAAVIYTKVFHRLGAGNVRVIDVRKREQANLAELTQAVEQATAVFFTGGEQERITNLLGGTRLDQALHRCHEGGMALGGTSAGAAMMSATMIVTGRSEATPRVGNVSTGPGMEFLHGVIIDQHFGQRGRSGRLLSALARYPHQLGIGIDEDTALVVCGDEFVIVGRGAVTVLDAGAATYNDALEREASQHVALCGVKLHVLTAGFRFNLTDRTPLTPRRANGTQENESEHHENHHSTRPARPEHLRREARSGRGHRTRGSDGKGKH